MNIRTVSVYARLPIVVLVASSLCSTVIANDAANSVRMVVLDSLRIGQQETISDAELAVLAQRMRSENGQIRWSAAWALGDGPEEAVVVAGAVARSEELYERRASALTLSQLTQQHSSALVPLCNLLETEDFVEKHYIRRGLERVTLETFDLRRTLVELPALCDTEELRTTRPWRNTFIPHIHNGLLWWHRSTLYELGPPHGEDIPMLRGFLKHEHGKVRQLARQQLTLLDKVDPVSADSEEFQKTHSDRRRTISAFLKTITKEDDAKAQKLALWELNKLAAPVFEEFKVDLGGAAPSRAEAIARLRAKFESIEEAKQVSSYLLTSRYRRSHYGSLVCAREALGISPAMGSGENELAGYAANVARVLSDDVASRDVRRLFDYGPAGVPFIAMHLNNSDRRVKSAALSSLRRMGYWAGEATPELVDLASREGGFALSVLERVDEDAYREIKERRENRVDTTEN